MILDLSNKGFSFNTKFITDPATITPGTFDGSEGDIGSSDLTLFVETATLTANMDLNTLPLPNTLGVCPGATLTVTKADAGGTIVEFTDPITNFTYAYVNKQGESITLEADTVNDQWVARV